jgi:imidazolonepropionase-like amidohydrolase
VTLVLGTRVTLARVSLPREGAKLAVAAEGDIDPPSGAVVMDAGGQFVTPRLFDAHSHLGGRPTPGAAAHLDGSGREPDTGPVAPQAQFADALWPQDPGIERAVAGGVTTIQVLSG